MSLLRKALASLDESHRRAVLEAHLGERVSRSLGHPLTAEDRTLPLSAIGLDSLKAVELQHGIELDLGISFPMADVLTAGSIAELAADVLERMMAAAPSSSRSPTGAASGCDAAVSRPGGALVSAAALTGQCGLQRRLRTAHPVAGGRRAAEAHVSGARRSPFLPAGPDSEDRNGRPWADIQEHEERELYGGGRKGLERRPPPGISGPADAQAVRSRARAPLLWSIC